MNKSKQPEVKKTLVRNPEQPAPKTLTVAESRASGRCTTDSTASVSGISTTGSQKEKPKVKTRFNTPELYSTLKLHRKIDEVVQPRKTKSMSDVDQRKLAVDEKVSRRVNFPFSQPVFKDLIPLMNNEVKAQPAMTLRGPTFPKDKEPVLSDFLEPRKSKVYYHMPSCSARTLDESRTCVSASGSLKLYKILQINQKRDQ